MVFLCCINLELSEKTRENNKTMERVNSLSWPSLLQAQTSIIRIKIPISKSLSLSNSHRWECLKMISCFWGTQDCQRHCTENRVVGRGGLVLHMRTWQFTQSSFHRFKNFVYTYRIFKDGRGFYNIQVRTYENSSNSSYERLGENLRSSLVPETWLRRGIVKREAT